MSFPGLNARALVVALVLATGSPVVSYAKPMPDGAPPENGGKSGDKKDAKAAAGAPESPYTDWAKVTKDATKKEGMFTAWTKRENLYWEIKKNQLNMPFLLNASYAKGIGLVGQLGGLPITDGLMQFERQGDHVFLTVPQSRIVSKGKDASYQRAVDLTFGNSVLQSFKIESEKDSTILIDMAPLFASDALDLSTRLKGATTKSF